MVRTRRGAPRLADANSLIIKKAPTGMSNRTTYIARRSFVPGVTPKHLEGYAAKFKEMAPKCASQVRGMPYGPEHVVAMRGCMQQNLAAGGKKSRARAGV